MLFPPTAVEVSQEIIRLKIKKSTSHNETSLLFLKTASDVIAPYLVLLVDYMVTYEIFPDMTKIAKAVPIHKSGANLKYKIIVR